MNSGERPWMNACRRFFRAAAAVWLTAACIAAGLPGQALASDYRLGYSTEPSNNDYIFTTKSPRGNVGKSMSISFRVRATDEDMNNLQVSLAETGDFQQIEERGEGDYMVDYYPFEILETTFVPKNVGNVKAGNVKSVSISARVRRDALQGYYSILFCWNGMTGDMISTMSMCGFPQVLTLLRMRRRT